MKETLNSQFVGNCKGVIERLTLKEKKMVWNRTTHIWCMFIMYIFMYEFIHCTMGILSITLSVLYSCCFLSSIEIHTWPQFVFVYKMSLV